MGTVTTRKFRRGAFSWRLSHFTSISPPFHSRLAPVSHPFHATTLQVAARSLERETKYSWIEQELAP
jgi:hypothetical protein